MLQKPAIKLYLLSCILSLLNSQNLTTQQVRIEWSGDAYSKTEYLYSRLNCDGLNYKAFQLALNGYKLLYSIGIVNKNDLVGIIDYSLPSTEKRFYVIDMGQPAVLYKTLVAHGKNSGTNYATHFSNQMGSHQSSLGFFSTGRTYQGQNGYSLVLNGLDTTFNERAKSRAVVMHGAHYVSDDYIKKYGRIGRSFGCPALPLDLHHEIIDIIKGGVMIFGYYPDNEYFERSWIINDIKNAEIMNETDAVDGSV